MDQACQTDNYVLVISSKLIEVYIQDDRLITLFVKKNALTMFRILILASFLFLYGCSQLNTMPEQEAAVTEQVNESSSHELQTDVKRTDPAIVTEALPETRKKGKESTPPAPVKKEPIKNQLTSTQPAESKKNKVSVEKTVTQTKTVQSDKTDPTSLFSTNHQLSVTPPAVDLNTMGVIEVLDFPFDPVENELSEFSSKNQDFAAYGFFTPDDKLETLINEELDSLRSAAKPLPPQKNLLDRIRKNMQLDLSLDNPRISAELSWYVRNPDYLTRVFNRSARYLYYVVSEVEARGLPMELALLPFVESAYNPFAYSHGRASGLWQFIPGTAKMYGMDHDWWYDGRRDVLASTEGALNYLTYLNNLFEGDWLHALAAYNSGSGRVSNAIKYNTSRQRKIDFWSLDLPKETRAYVPKLIALAKIVKNPKTYNIIFPYIADAPYFEKVEIGGQIDLAQAAELAKVDITEIYQLNPGFNQWASSPLGPHHLLIPVEQAKIFKQNIKKLPPEKRLNWHRYTVKRGDSLIKIANKYQTTPMLIREINHLKSNMIRARQKLLIPVASKSSQYYDLSEDNRLQKTQDSIQAKKGTDKISYRVKSGDTIWELAREHKVGVRELARWNGLAPKDPIHPGQTLTIWSNKPILTAIQNINTSAYQKREMIQKVGYYVRKGDSLAKIASKFSVTVKDLIAWNKLDVKKYIKPGQKLTIYVDITNT